MVHGHYSVDSTADFCGGASWTLDSAYDSSHACFRHRLNPRRLCRDVVVLSRNGRFVAHWSEQERKKRLDHSRPLSGHSTSHLRLSNCDARGRISIASDRPLSGDLRLSFDLRVDKGSG